MTAPDVTVLRFWGPTLDCPDPAALARFYQTIAGGDLAVVDDAFAELRFETFSLGFQRDPDHRPPTWPDPAIPQQCHLDFSTPDLDADELRVLAAGATKTVLQPEPATFRVYLDPAGHPFCLTTWRTAAGPAYSR